MGGRKNGWIAKVDNVVLRLGGFAKVDNRFEYEEWLGGAFFENAPLSGLLKE